MVLAIFRRVLGARRLFITGTLVAALSFTGCKRDPSARKFSSETVTPPAEIWKEFSGGNAMAHAKAQVDFGPRPSGSTALAQTRNYLVEQLKKAGWEVTPQAFNAQTPRGQIAFVNLIATYSGAPKDSQTVLIVSHYDTKFFDTIQFVGADDGASSTGALLEMARVLAKDPDLAWRVQLVFFDGEEAVQGFTDTDGLYGSRHFAEDLQKSGRASQFTAGILWDMIGDRNLRITLPPDSPAALAKLFFQSADTLEVRDHFSYYEGNILDDHTPLNKAGIPTIDLIDFRFEYWHTADDTLDKLSPQSLQTVGAVTLHALRQMFPK